MAILNFQKPDKIVLQKANDFEAQFEFRPWNQVMVLPLEMLFAGCY